MRSCLAQNSPSCLKSATLNVWPVGLCGEHSSNAHTLRCCFDPPFTLAPLLPETRLPELKSWTAISSACQSICHEPPSFETAQPCTCPVLSEEASATGFRSGTGSRVRSAFVGAASCPTFNNNQCETRWKVSGVWWHAIRIYFQYAYMRFAFD